MKEKYKKENLEPIIVTSKNWTDVLRKLDMSIHGNSRTTLKKYVKKQNINISHFESKEERYLRVNGEIGKIKQIPLKEILISGSTYTNTHLLKEKLYNEGLKERKCEKCGQDEMWYGEKISLILDHINGDNTDNRYENLRILCPNCNATLPTHCGKNKKQKYHCSCGNTKNKTSKYSKECNNKFKRKIIRPTKEELVLNINNLGYCGTGRKYGVSDNAIRKWVKCYNNVD